MTTLVIGSMAPDFDYLFHTQFGTSLSHSIAGMFYYCLPVTIVVACVWHFIIKESLASALPPSWLRKYSDWLTDPWDFKSVYRLLIIPVSALAGILSHLAWDSFTHISGYFVMKFSFLTQSTMIYHLPVFKLMQYGFGIIGGVLVLFVLGVHSSQKPLPALRRYPFQFWISAGLVFVAYCSTRTMALSQLSIAQELRFIFVYLSSGISASILIASTIVKFFHMVRTRSEK